MMNFIKKIYQHIITYINALFWGMKSTEEIVFTQTDAITDGTSIQQQITSNRVSHALRRGELTQEVKELRYRTYKVDRESKQYQYYAPTLAIKRDNKLESKFVIYENEDNLPITTIQPNAPLTEGISELMLDTYGKRTEYVIHLKRNFVPRFRLEEYTKRLVVKEIDKKNYVLDFYVSMYPNDKDFKSKGFVSEINKIHNDNVKSDILDFNEVSFITNKAYKMFDMVKFVFIKPIFKKIVEFDGHYIVRFESELQTEHDKIDDFYCKEMAERYDNKEKKNIVYDMLGGNTIEKFYCEECGKEIIYDTQRIDNAEITMPRDIADEETPLDTNTTEYMDIQIAEQTFGKRLCSDCLRKYSEK